MFKIGPYEIKNPYILAPMAGVSQMPFRKLALGFGASLAPTELISAKGLIFSSMRSESYLIHDSIIENPFWVQIFGGDPKSMGLASLKAISFGAHMIDINMGCPVKKVTKTNAGSALLCEIDRACDIVREIKAHVGEKVPITVKIRSGWDEKNLNFLDNGKRLEDEGIKAISLHARSRAQGYSGKANWDHIALLKEKLSIPVIGNGDVKSFDDAKKMQEHTNCDGVMIGRAALGNPWIFKEMLTGEIKISAKERLNVLKKHLADHIELQEKISKNLGIAFLKSQAIKSFRCHLMWYSRGLSMGASFRSLVMTIESEDKLLDLCEKFFLNSSYALKDNSLGQDDINYSLAFG